MIALLLTYIMFMLTTFLFTWYSYKLIRDVSGRDQYWHYPQMFVLVAFYLMPGAILLGLNHYAALVYIIRAISWGLMFPFIFNTGLNIYRINAGTNISWKHLGEYDFLTFTQTVLLFIAGILSTIVINIFL